MIFAQFYCETGWLNLAGNDFYRYLIRSGPETEKLGFYLAYVRIIHFYHMLSDVILIVYWVDWLSWKEREDNLSYQKFDHFWEAESRLSVEGSMRWEGQSS